MTESHNEKYSRLQQMILDDGQTWDLSPNDKSAIRHILGVVNVLADELAEMKGLTIPGVIEMAAKIVERYQK